MSRLLEFLLGSLLIPVFTVALVFFSSLHYILKTGGVADCIWQGSVQAWADSNGDGRLNPGEASLRDVEIHVDDVRNQLVNVGWSAITDEEGEVQLHVPVHECADTLFEIYVDIPQGYRLTISSRIEVQPDNWESLGTQPIYRFGLIAEP